MKDTSYDTEKHVATELARRTPAQRLRMACSMFETARGLIRAGLLAEDKSLTEPQIRARTFIRLYGDCFSQSRITHILARMPRMRLDDNLR